MGYSVAYNDTQSHEVIHYKSEFSKFHNKYMDILSKDSSKINENVNDINFKYIDGDNMYNKPLYIFVDNALTELIEQLASLKRNQFKMYIDIVYNNIDTDINVLKELISAIDEKKSAIAILRRFKIDDVKQVIDDSRLPEILVENKSKQLSPVKENTIDDDAEKPLKVKKDKLAKIDKKIKKKVSHQNYVDINLEDVKTQLKESSLLFNKEEVCLCP